MSNVKKDKSNIDTITVNNIRFVEQDGNFMNLIKLDSGNLKTKLYW